jgi:hypothetical protein
MIIHSNLERSARFCLQLFVRVCARLPALRRRCLLGFFSLCCLRPLRSLPPMYPAITDVPAPILIATVLCQTCSFVPHGISYRFCFVSTLVSSRVAVCQVGRWSSLSACFSFCCVSSDVLSCVLPSYFPHRPNDFITSPIRPNMKMTQMKP